MNTTQDIYQLFDMEISDFDTEISKLVKDCLEQIPDFDSIDL